MKNTTPTIEHLLKQIEFYRGEEDRVSKQLDEIQTRLKSDREVLDILESKRREDINKQGGIPVTNPYSDSIDIAGSQQTITTLSNESLKPYKH